MRTAPSDAHLNSNPLSPHLPSHHSSRPSNSTTPSPTPSRPPNSLNSNYCKTPLHRGCAGPTSSVAVIDP
jgi:hypothetical protein